MPIFIEAWSVHHSGDAYTPPEMRTQHLRGIVRGHPKKPDGTTIYTSALLRAEGRQAFTESGSVYELGEPHPEYQAWCQKEGKPIDPVQPIKMISQPADAGQLDA